MASKSWKFAETSHATSVGLNKTDVKFQKELASLERQQNTAMNNIANYQQAMKMSWRRLEERRAESPTLSKKIDQSDNKKQKKGLLLQSNTKLYVNKTPSIYNPTSQPGGEIAAKDDSVLESTSFSSARIQARDHKGPPPTALNEFKNSPYVSSPYSFRRAGIQTADGVRGRSSTFTNGSGGSETDLTDRPSSSVDLQASSSQVSMIRRTDTNKKSALLKASNILELGSATGSSGPDAFKGFYGRPGTRGSEARSSLGAVIAIGDDDDEDDDEDKEESEEPPKEKTAITLAEMFDQIRNCRYIRHYYPDGTTMDEYTD